MKVITCIFAIATLLMTSWTIKGQDFTADSLEICAPERPQLSVVTPYFLQHQYLSIIAPVINESDGEMILSTPYILNTISANGNGFMSPFADDEIQVELIENEGRKVYVWRFPEPQHLREALYIAFIPIDGMHQAVAISIGATVDWEISTSTETARQVLGRVKRPESAAECVELLKSRGAFTGDITMGELFQEGYQCPE